MELKTFFNKNIETKNVDKENDEDEERESRKGNGLFAEFSQCLY